MHVYKAEFYLVCTEFAGHILVDDGAGVGFEGDEDSQLLLCALFLLIRSVFPTH